MTIHRCNKCIHNNNSKCDKSEEAYLTKGSFICDSYQRRKKSEIKSDPKVTKEKPKLVYCNTNDICFAFYGDA